MKDTLHIWVVWTLFVGLVFSCSRGEVPVIRQPAELPEHRTKVAIIDTGLDESKIKPNLLCREGQQDLTGEGKGDRVGHGTNIAGIIARNIDPTLECILPIKVYQRDSIFTASRIVEGLNLAKQMGVKFVNLSMGGELPSFWEERAMRALTEVAEVSVPSGNDGRNLNKDCAYYPACYKDVPNMWVIGADNLRSSNYGSVVKAYLPGSLCGFNICMSGTSQATAAWTALRLIHTRTTRKRQ